MRKPHSFRIHSLKSRSAIAVTVLFILFCIVCGFIGDRYLEYTIRETVHTGQFSYVTSLASSLDDKLALVQKSLEQAAAHMDPDIVRDADKTQRYLDSQYVLTSFFDNALFLFSAEGKIIAESPFIEGRRGRDISFRSYFQATMASGKPHISDPYLSTHKPGHPAVILTAPVHDRQGRIIALLSGSFDLLGKNNILADLAAMKSGKQGYVYLFTPERVMVMHPDRARIMKQDVPPGSNLLYDRAIAGFEGSGETTNSRGLHVLASFKRLKSTGWILGANFPVEEALAPLASARRYYLGGLAVSALMVISGIWFMMRLSLAPLSRMIRYFEDPSNSRTVLPNEYITDDEIGDLALVYNRIIAEQLSHDSMMRSARDAAEAANRAKTDFLSNMSHEIRTPMNGILGMTQLLKMTELTAEQQEFLRHIDSSGRSLLLLINDILDLSKIESGLMSLENSPFSLKDSVTGTVSAQLPAISGKHLTITCQIDPDLPPVVIGDQLRFRQIILNLLGNAIKFTSVGSIVLTVSVESRGDDVTVVRVSIVDTGIGMTPEQLTKVFDAFTQADSTITRRYGGTGLGLTICSRLVQLMGGGMQVESRQGEGSGFHVSLPFGVTRQEEASPPVTPAGKDLCGGTCYSILVVEDNPVNQKFISAILLKMGHSIVCADDGLQAVEAWRSGRFDCVFMDIQMPVMGGEEALQQIRREEAATGGHIPVIALTAYALKGDRERFLAGGFDGYLAKPVSINEVAVQLEMLAEPPEGGKVK